MDLNQQQTILRAIAISSLHLPGFTPSDHQAAYKILEDLKRYDGRIALCVAWLDSENHVFSGEHDITTATKLLALEILSDFLVKGYSQCSEAERVALRQAVLKASRALALSASPHAMETRILARKLAVILEGLVLRDFPQRWVTLATDLFAPLSQGGLWSAAGETDGAASSTVGVKICLECFKLVAEDCTDSDFNAKISTARRNDVLTGLNEISSTFLPLYFQLLEHNYPILQQSKASLHSMHQYLLSENRTTANMSADEAAVYQKAVQQRKEVSVLIADTLVTLEKFCATLPVTWMLGGDEKEAQSSSDFVAAMLHLLREPDAEIQLRSMECLEQLALRGKMDFHQWMRMITELPRAFQEANQLFTTTEQEFRTTQLRATNSNDGPLPDQLTQQLDFHRPLARLLSSVISSYISHISSSKQILGGTGKLFDNLNVYFRLLVDMLHHPSGRILTEQVNTWSNLYRDPQISKCVLLKPFANEILTSTMDHMVRLRWEDVENETHPHWQLMEASFDDEDDYNAWMMDLRSRASLLFKFIGNTHPQIASQVLNARVQALLKKHGNGEPIGFVDSSNNQLTSKSEAVMQFEGIFQPLDNTLGGIPSWAIASDQENNKSYVRDQNDQQRAGIRASTRLSLAELATALVNWTPSFVWLKFRHAALLEPLRHYWKHEPSTLLQGIDTLIRYLGLPDEWRATNSPPGATDVVSTEIVALKKKSGVSLVSISKQVPHHLVPWLSQLSEATRSLLASDGLIPLNQMHLYEFLSCVATAVENPHERSKFIGEVLSDALSALESAEIQQSIQSASSLLNAFGVSLASQTPEKLTDPETVNAVRLFYGKLFTPLNRLLSVGRRCGEAARKRSVLGGVSLESLPNAGFGGPGQPAFPPDEGPLSIQDLATNDPFAPLWPRILPTLLQVYESTLNVWRPENQAALLQNQYQRYAYAISDDEAYLAKTQNIKASGGVFGEGGTAGSVVAGACRRDINLVPKWSGWFNELRNTCFQLLGLLTGQRTLYAPELANMYPRIVSVLTDPLNLKSMEHRHFTQFMKHVVELLLISCPCSLYKTHLEPILGPIMDHIRYRFEKTWLPVLSPDNTGGAGGSSLAISKTTALCSADCGKVAGIASQGEEAWFSWYYAHAGLFVGDLDPVTAEAAVEKYRVDICRSFSDVLQAALALKGDWALVLANLAKEEQAAKKNDATILATGPRNCLLSNEGTALNADGTPKLAHQAATDARKMLRINALCHFLLLESEGIAGNLTLTVIQCLGYPDAYTCRRILKICHRILETVAWSPQYSQLLGQQLFTQTVKNLVTEPKWMVGVEWDMINVVRDIYCRLVLGQILQAGGQGMGQQQPSLPNGNGYEQAKSVDVPLQGGGILVTPSSYPREILASLPGIGAEGVQRFEAAMKEKKSAKDQKDYIRDLLRVAADNLGELNPKTTGEESAAGSIFDRAVAEESLLHEKSRAKVVQDIPEKLVTQSQVNKAAKQAKQQQEHSGGLYQGLVDFSSP